MRFKPWSSVAFRLALNYGALVLLTMCMVLAIFYVQTVGVLQHRIDRQIDASLGRLVDNLPVPMQTDALAVLVKRELRDGENSDTEIYLLMDAQGRKVIGNIGAVSPALLHESLVHEIKVLRDGRETVGRLRARKLEQGETLVVGSDMQPLREVERLFARASLLAAIITLVMTIGGAFVFRHEVEQRAGEIRKAVARVADGDLGARIPVSDRQDEFTRLDRDINGMLDRLEQLMDGIRHVSNTIAHNLRTPLTRILLRLRTAESEGPQQQAQALQFAAQEVAELGVVFDKLLHIAEVEAGARRQAFVAVPLNDVVTDVLEFYEPVAEERGVQMLCEMSDDMVVAGDADLIASALANLVDNALKYTGADGQGVVRVQLTRHADRIDLVVCDNGVGVDGADLTRIGTRFYRANRSRQGYGLGLASVQAIVRQHGGDLTFSSAEPGLSVRISLPALLT